MNSLFPPPLSNSIVRSAEGAGGFGKAPVALVSEIDGVAARMFAAAASANLGKAASLDQGQKATMVQLRAPGVVPGEKGEDGKEKLTLEALMAYLAELLGDMSLSSLKSRLEAFVERMQAQKAAGERLSAALKEAQGQAEAAVEGAEGAAGEAAKAAEAAEAARVEAERLQAELDALPADSEDYDALAKKVKAATDHADTLAGKAEKALAASNAAASKAADALEKVESIYDDMDAAAAARAPHLNPPDEGRRNTQAQAAYLLARLSELVSLHKDAKLKSDTDFILERLEKIQEANKRASDEYKAEVEKARQAEKTMGCIGKVIGWVITVVSVVLAPVTGGASMALAAVGLALAIVEETTGFSLIGEAMKPLMEEVLPFLTKLFADMAGAVLKGLGVDDKLAEDIAQWFGMAAGAIFMVAAIALAVVVGKAAASKLLTPLLKAVGQSVSKAMPEVVKAAGKAVAGAPGRLTGALARKLGTGVDDLATRVGYMMTVSQVGQFANQTSQGIGRVVVADMRMDAAEVLGQLDFGLILSQQARAEMNHIFDQFARSNDVVQWVNKKMIDVLAEEASTAKFVIGKMRA